MTLVARTALLAMSLSFVFAAHAADRVRVANEGAIGDAWKIADGATLGGPSYPAQYKERADDVCVSIGYSINPDGKTGDFTVLKTWSNGTDLPKDFFDAFTSAGAAAVSTWQFQPRPEVTKPQRTITAATLVFGGFDAKTRMEFAANCKITDLAAFLQEHRADIAQRDMRRELERDTRAARSNGNMTSNPAAAQQGSIYGSATR